MANNKLLSFGENLLKGNFEGAVKSLTPYYYPSEIEISPAEFRNQAPERDWFFASNGVDYHFAYVGIGDAKKAYERCAPINAIVNRKAQSYINGVPYVLNTQGKEANTPDAKKIRARLQNPNPLQTQKQFEAQGYIYYLLFGFNLMLSVKPAGFLDNVDADALWNIPPTMVDIKETQKLFYQSGGTGVKEVVLEYKGERTTIPINDLFIFKDYTPSFNSMVFPESRLRALQLPINNIIGAYESRNVLMNSRGALGILSHDTGNGTYASIPIEEKEKQKIQSDFRRYGIRKDQWQVIITDANLKWQQMALPTKDLMLFEEIEDDIARCCDGMGYPDFLISSRQKTTFDNVNEGRKMLYQEFTIPDAQNIYEQWNNFFKTSERNISIQKDFNDIPVLQEDKQKMAAARATLGAELMKEFDGGFITFNRVLELLNESTRPGYDKYKKDLPEFQNEENIPNGQEANAA